MNPTKILSQPKIRRNHVTERAHSDYRSALWARVRGLSLPYNVKMRRPRRFQEKHKRDKRHSHPRTERGAAESHGERSLVAPPTYHHELRDLLAGIGTPEPSPFQPDPFQLEALAALEFEDVLVTAPTGSGKTWIAREEIRRLLEAGKRAWYTTPLKALTNSKYAEFIEEFGAGRVGILTGDRKENSAAPLIVGTTEIFRNQLFDALRGGEEVNVDLVVFDEAHYLADEDRGHVWEEAIILTPNRIRMLLLSATIGNAREFAQWIEELRGVRCGVVTRPGARPVPLRSAFLLPDRRLVPLLGKQGKLNSEIARLTETAEKDHRPARRRY
jgi:ATP-dependent RNA helicase HelY